MTKSIGLRRKVIGSDVKHNGKYTSSIGIRQCYWLSIVAQS